jgi:hypothetical protein
MQRRAFQQHQRDAFAPRAGIDGIEQVLDPLLSRGHGSALLQQELAPCRRIVPAATAGQQRRYAVHDGGDPRHAPLQWIPRRRPLTRRREFHRQALRGESQRRGNFAQRHGNVALRYFNVARRRHAAPSGL